MKIKLLVVDNDSSTISRIMEYFNGGKIEIVKTINDGKDALEQLKAIDFDVMLLDLILPNKDGYAILEYMKKSNINKPVIVCSAFSSEESIKKLCNYNVKYFALKPYDLEDLKDKIKTLSISYESNNKLDEIQNKDIQIKVTQLLHALGIPSHIKGYQLIRSAILLVYDNPGYIGGITKELYPYLANKFDSSPQKVERSIRHAIEVSWLRGDIDLMEEIFGHSVDIDRAKPTNSEFIVTIADKLRLDMINHK